MKNLPTHAEAMRQAQYLSLTEYQGFMKCFHWMIEYAEEAETKKMACDDINKSCESLTDRWNNRLNEFLSGRSPE